MLCTTYHTMFDGRFRKQATEVMEVGVFKGKSLLMWESYFPSATITGVDHFVGEQGSGTVFHDPLEFVRWLQYQTPGQPSPGGRVKVLVADQRIRAQYEELAAHFQGKKSFDVIVEDGSHTYETQKMTLGVLFPLVRPGGYYVLEDLGSSWHKKFGADKVPFSKTPIGMLDAFVRGGKSAFAEEGIFKANEAAYLARCIECVFFVVDDPSNPVEATSLIKKSQHSDC